MAREKETYRSILDRLDERFPNRELISQKDFADLFTTTLKTLRLSVAIPKHQLLNCLRGEPMYAFLMLCIVLTVGAVFICDIKK